jgi:hypothetical protein
LELRVRVRVRVRVRDRLQPADLEWLGGVGRPGWQDRDRLGIG